MTLCPNCKKQELEGDEEVCPRCANKKDNIKVKAIAYGIPLILGGLVAAIIGGKGSNSA